MGQNALRKQIFFQEKKAHLNNLNVRTGFYWSKIRRSEASMMQPTATATHLSIGNDHDITPWGCRALAKLLSC